MAKDVITRFKLETTGFDSKIKNAARELSDVAKAAKSAGSDFERFTKDQIEAAKALGNMATSSTNAKDKTKELVGAFNDLARSYNHLSEEQQRSDFGKAMSQSLTQLQQRIKETKAEMQSMNNVSANMGGGLSGMVGNVSSVLGVSPAMLTSIGAATAAFASFKEVIGGNIETAKNFEKSMSQLSSLTGMVGKDLDKLKDYAIELGSTSTLTASQVADAFRLIGSQQPQLLESGEALKEVTKYAITLSEAAGIDLVTAAQTLSTSINQMGGDSNNAARYVNVLAAASQKGAGDIAWLGEAITKSATAAKAVGTDYEELVGNLEQLAKAGFDASTAGTALRSIIMNLEKQANNDFKPSIVGLTQAFENLGKANLDITGYQEIAGKMFASQAMALANAAQEAKNMTVAITGTNTATEQASTNTANLDGSLKALASAWEGLNLHINSSNGLLKEAVDWLKDVVTWVDKAISGMDKFADRKSQMNNEGAGEGNTRIDSMIRNLKGSSDSQKSSVYNQQVEQFYRYINKKEAELQKTQNTNDIWAWETIGKNNKISQLTQDIGAAKQMLQEYQQRAKSLLPTSESGGNGKVTIPIDADTEGAKKSIKELQSKLKELKKLRDEASENNDFEARDDYNKQIKSVQTQIKSLRGDTSTKKELTEIQENQKKINDLSQEYQKLATAAKTANESQSKGIAERMTAIKGEIQTLQDRNKELKQFAEDAQRIEYPTGSIQQLNQQLQDLQKAQSQALTGQEWQDYQKQIEQTQRQISALKGQWQNGWEATFTVDADDTKAMQALKDVEGVKIDGKTVTVTANTQQAYNQIQTLLKDVSNKKVEIAVTPKIETGTSIQNAKGMQEYIGILKQELEEADYGTSVYNGLAASLADMTTLQNLVKESLSLGLGTSMFDVADELGMDFWTRAMEGGVENTDWDSIMEQLNEKLKDKDLDPIELNYDTGEVTHKKKKDGKDSDKETLEIANKVVSGLSQVSSGLSQMGIVLPQGVTDVLSGLQGLMSVINGVMTIIDLFGATSLASQTFSTNANTGALVANEAAIGSLTAALYTTSLLGFSNGGVVKAANGNVVRAANGIVTGTTYSGDEVPALLNAGEVVLNRAQAGALAADLEGGGGSTKVFVEGVIDGDVIRLVQRQNNDIWGRTN